MADFARPPSRLPPRHPASLLAGVVPAVAGPLPSIRADGGPSAVAVLGDQPGRHAGPTGQRQAGQRRGGPPGRQHRGAVAAETAGGCAAEERVRRDGMPGGADREPGGGS